MPPPPHPLAELTAPEPAPDPDPTAGTTRLQIHFPVRRDANLHYRAQFAATPAGPWHDAPHHLTPLDHHWSQATAIDPEETPQTKRFARVEITEVAEIDD